MRAWFAAAMAAKCCKCAWKWASCSWKSTAGPTANAPAATTPTSTSWSTRRCAEGDSFELSSAQCTSADREFLQYYHRRICWLALREFRRAVRDADHTLAFMDFVRAHSSDEQWVLSHEQYRPYVLFHRTQASVLAKLEEVGAEAALQELNQGLCRFRDLFAEYDAEEQFGDDEMVQRLQELKDALRNQYHLKPSLEERLADAVAAEQYELAARLRDEMTRKRRGSAS